MQPAASGRTLGRRYRLLEHLATGGMASVWIGEDTLLARRVAVKVLLPALSADRSLRARFRNEAISSASIEDPGIVAVYDAGEDDGVVYIVMEFVEGQDLRHLLDDEGPLRPMRAVHIAERVATALDHAHRNGVVHRDIKPANVLVSADGRIKVTDFGIAKASRDDSDLTGTGAVLGTARYLAPEQVRGQPADHRADVYATGLLLYEMLTMRLPFRGDTDLQTAIARLSAPPAPLPPETPTAVAAVVERCLALDPTRRYPTAGALAEALARLLDGDPTAPREVTATLPAPPRPPVPVPPRQPARVEPAPPRRRARRWVAVAVVAVLAVAIAGAVLAARLGSGGGTAPPPGGAPAALRLVGAQDFDPLGDGHENHALVGRAIDGNLLTAWPTETYDSRDFGHAKAGVGIYVTLASPSVVDGVSVVTLESGWNAAIYAAADPSPTLTGWGRPLAVRTGLGTQTEFTFRTRSQVRVVLLWITYLPATGRLDVAEIRIR
jgi:eukaryotic-like serine/threonine-protein kinase